MRIQLVRLLISTHFVILFKICTYILVMNFNKVKNFFPKTLYCIGYTVVSAINALYNRMNRL
jgi:hypothetical protein